MEKKKPENIFTEFNVKIIPRSSRNDILGREGSVYRIKVTSPPVDGKANKTLITLLSNKIKIPKKDIQIISGEKSRNKRIRINGVSGNEITRLLD